MPMNPCEKVRRYLPSLASENLSSVSDDRMIHQHLEDCSDCQKSLEKTRRLQALLQWKRDEQPGEFFFRTFGEQFRRRLYAEMARKRTLWDRICNAVAHKEPSHLLLRLTYMTGLCVIVLSLYTAHILMENNAPQSLSSNQYQKSPIKAKEPVIVEVSTKSDHLVFTEHTSNKGPVYVLDLMRYEPSTRGSDILQL